MKKNVSRYMMKLAPCICWGGAVVTLWLANISAGAEQTFDQRFQECLSAEVALPEVKALTGGPKYHWYGYYDILQFDPHGRYVLGMATDFNGRAIEKDDVVEVGMIDLLDPHLAWTRLGESRAWCWQQGCRPQWRPGSDSEVLWNDREEGRFVCRILNVKTKKLRTLPYPIYHVSPDGQWGVGLDFARLGEAKPAYGYVGVSDPYRDQPAPKETGIYKINLETGEYKFLISFAQVDDLIFGEKSRPVQRKLYFNHLMWNPDNSRFLFFARGRNIGTYVYTAAADGTDLRFLGRNCSHYTWKDDQTLLIWTEGAYRIYKDDGKAKNEILFRAPNGHQTYLPGGEWLITDSYPLDRQGDRMQHLYLFHLPSRRIVLLGHFRSEPEYQGDWRCDLHARLSPDGTKVIFDSSHGKNGRQMYMMDIAPILASVKEGTFKDWIIWDGA